MAIRKHLKSLRSRERNGQAQRPTTRSARQAGGIMAVALAQPHRIGRTYTQLDGHVVGRMFRGGRLGGHGVGLARLQAAERFARLAVRYMRDVAGCLPRFPSAMAERIAGETGDGWRPTDEAVAKIRSEWHAAMRALADHGLYTEQGLLVRACVLDRDLSPGEQEVFNEMLDCLREAS